MKRSAHPPRRRSGGSASTPSRPKTRKSAQRKTQFNPLHIVACSAAAAQQYIALSDDYDDGDDDEESNSSEAGTATGSPVAVKGTAEGDKRAVAWGTLVWERHGGFANSSAQRTVHTNDASSHNATTQRLQEHSTCQRRCDNWVRPRQHSRSAARLFAILLLTGLLVF